MATSDGALRTASMVQQTWGQIVVGPPGSGKTTYCQGMKMFMDAIERPAIVVNLDPANNDTPYVATINITDLITVEDVMETLELGKSTKSWAVHLQALVHANFLAMLSFFFVVNPAHSV